LALNCRTALYRRRPLARAWASSVATVDVHSGRVSLCVRWPLVADFLSNCDAPQSVDVRAVGSRRATSASTFESTQSELRGVGYCQSLDRGNRNRPKTHHRSRRPSPRPDTTAWNVLLRALQESSDRHTAVRNGIDEGLFETSPPDPKEVHPRDRGDNRA
jgi:hypothetical protein